MPDPTILPGKSYKATALPRDENGNIVNPLPVGSHIFWQESTPELLNFTSSSEAVLKFMGKSGLLNPAPVAGVLTAVYQDADGNVVRGDQAFLLAPDASTPPGPDPTPPPAGSIVKSIGIVITPEP